jgi:hypothetical protein
MVGGVAAAAAVRTFPFRVFSFPREIVVRRPLPGLALELESILNRPAEFLFSPGRMTVIMHPDELKLLKSLQDKFGRPLWSQGAGAAGIEVMSSSLCAPRRYDRTSGLVGPCPREQWPHVRLTRAVKDLSIERAAIACYATDLVR